MKGFPVIICALAVFASSAVAQFAGMSAAYRGDYFGIMIPSAKCSNERLGVDITIDSDGHLTGEIRNYDNAQVFSFAQNWPFFDKGKFTSDITELGNYVKGTANKTGSLRGTAVIGGCKYTFTAYRRYRIAQ